jgi:L-ribulose-5-phosphate 3-epimerase
MLISTFSYLWSHSAMDAIAELSRAGYREFEVPVSSPHCWPAEMPPSVRSETRRRLQDCGATVRSLNPGGYDLNLASPAANMRRKSIDHIKDVMDLAFEWGSTELVMSPGTRRPMISPSLSNTLGWLTDSLEVLLPRAEQAGVRMLLENTPYCFRPTLDEMVGVTKQFNSERLKIVYDVANAAYIKEDPVAGLLAGGAEIVLVHISDTSLEEWGHDPIGTGVIDFEALGKAVDATCTTENAVLEIIRERNPLAEMHAGIGELKKRGWSINH